ncbi:hypothetical protein [Halorubellus litoreus]|uniref:Uncharacterized protein n=1 Tax=Halorubellus litoreus TaxID=755308 RepID=A0ABD5VA51_9EURY
MLNLRSYLLDVRSAFDTYWWLPTLALPIAFFAIPVYLYASKAFGTTFAQMLLSWYAIVGSGIVIAAALGHLLWSRVAGNDDDHPVP